MQKRRKVVHADQRARVIGTKHLGIVWVVEGEREVKSSLRDRGNYDDYDNCVLRLLSLDLIRRGRRGYYAPTTFRQAHFRHRQSGDRQPLALKSKQPLSAQR